MKKTMIALALTGVMMVSACPAFAADTTASQVETTEDEWNELLGAVGAEISKALESVDMNAVMSEVEGLAGDLFSELGIDSFAEGLMEEFTASLKEGIDEALQDEDMVAFLDELCNQEGAVAEALQTTKNEDGTFNADMLYDAVVAVLSSGDAESVDINGVTITEADITELIETLEAMEAASEVEAAA